VATIGVERRDGVGWLILDNENRRNALCLAMYEALPAAAATLAADRRVRVVVLRGAGNGAFGAGSDISEFAARRVGAAAEHYNQVEHEARAAIRALDVPVIAQIHGPCRGGALALALGADLRLADTAATFAVPPARLGVGYDPRAVADLVAAVGDAHARRLLLTAAVIDATEAVRIGLVHEVHEPVDLEAAVLALATGISALAPLSLRAAKHALRGDATAVAAAALCYDSSDYREGIAAFLEKRSPRFTGEPPEEQHRT
jgi:enoyl-CoA hydratase